MSCNTEIPPPPKMTEGGSEVQLFCDFQSWLLWAKTYHPTAPAKIRKEAARRAKLCGYELDIPPELSEKEAKPMAAKKKAAAKPPIDKRAISVYAPEGADFDLAVNKTFLTPQVTAARNIQAWNSELSVHGLRKALVTEIDEVAKGNMARPEAMLLCQAHTLDFLFSELCQQAHNNQTYIANYESIMRMAFRAQNQCRCTLETLANIKNGPVIFAKQANIANNQKINNGVPEQALVREENQNLQSKLLTELPHETLDTGRTGEAVPVNSELEALGQQHGAKIGSG
jgi:hypothetical protein